MQSRLKTHMTEKKFSRNANDFVGTVAKRLLIYELFFTGKTEIVSVRNDQFGTIRNQIKSIWLSIGMVFRFE